MTQNQRIEKHLRSGKSLTPLQALRLYGSFRLGARIFQLRKKMKIESERVKGKHYAKYWLA